MSRRTLMANQGMYIRVGEAIRAARREECISSADLADRIGCSATHMQKIETAETPCSLHMLVRIAEELDLSLDELVPVAIDEKELAS